MKKLYFFIAIKPGLRICRRFQLPRRPRRGKLNTYRAANALCPTQMNGGATMKRLSTSFPVGDTPLDEYPRPQMVRAQWQNLNGLWQYAVTESPEQPAVWQGGIRVPFAPESALSGVEKPVLPGQPLWYFRTFSINGYDAAKRTLLHFGAVDYACTVFVNGREAGGHTGGYCPFTLDITSFVRAAENELTVAVTDDTDKGDAPRGKQVLHPKGIWYTAVTGIWQTVWLEQVDSAHFTSVHFIPSLDSVEVFVQASESGSVCMEVLEEDSCITAHTFMQQLDSDVEKMINEGVATKADGLSVRVKVNEAEMTLTKVEDGLSLARMLLCQLCGIDLSSPITLADENMEDIPLLTTDPHFDLSTAYENRPEIRSLELATQIYKQKVNVTRAEHLPSIALMGNYMLTNPSVFNSFENKFKGMWNVGVMVQIPIWHWGEGIYKTRAAKAEARIAQYQLQDAREKIELQVNQAAFKVKEAGKKLVMSSKNMEKAEENLRYATLGFKEGVIATSNVLEAQTAWLSAHSEKIDAQIDVKLTEIYLKKSLGTLK